MMKRVIRWGIAVIGLGWAVLGFAGGKININTADLETLDSLEQIGPVKAELIILYREQHGPFQKVEDLARVRGIGVQTVEINRDRIEVSPQPY